MGKRLVVNPSTGKLDFINEIPLLSTAPTSSQQGWMYINSVNDTLYVYYGNTWQALHILTPEVFKYLLQEDDSYILCEDGTKLAMEI